MLKYLDFLSMRPEIYVKGEKRYFTWFGGALSIIAGCICIFITCSFLTDLVGRKSMQIYDNKLQVRMPYMNYENYPLAASLVFSNGTPVQTNIYEIYAFNLHYRLQNNTTTRDVKIAGKMQLCTDEDNSPYFNFTKGMLCTPRTFNSSLYGKAGNLDTGYNMIYFGVHKCINGSFIDEIGGVHNNTNCANKDVIESVSSDVFLLIELLDNSMDHNNIEPFKPVKRGLSFSLSQALFRLVNVYIQNVQYNLDFGYVFEEIQTIETWRYFNSDAALSIKSFKSGKFSAFNVAMIDDKVIYNRSYRKLQATLANIGGFTNLIISVAQIIVNFFSQNLYSFYLIDKLFFIQNFSQENNIVNISGNNDNNNSLQKLQDNNYIRSHKIHPENEIENKNEKEETKKSVKENPHNNLMIYNTVNQNNTHESNILFNQSSILKKKLAIIENSERVFKYYTIWDMILSFFIKNRYKRLSKANERINKILSTNSLLKMNFKLNNLIDVVLIERNENIQFMKIKKVNIDEIK